MGRVKNLNLSIAMLGNQNAAGPHRIKDRRYARLYRKQVLTPQQQQRRNDIRDSIWAEDSELQTAADIYRQTRQRKLRDKAVMRSLSWRERIAVRIARLMGD